MAQDCWRQRLLGTVLDMKVDKSVSRKAFIKAGFEVVAECDYKDFTVEGEKVFRDITGHKGVALLIKMLD